MQNGNVFAIVSHFGAITVEFYWLGSLDAPFTENKLLLANVKLGWK
jgi:hypothetical protein